LDCGLESVLPAKGKRKKNVENEFLKRAIGKNQNLAV